jgi:hypothetical protein
MEVTFSARRLAAIGASALAFGGAAVGTAVLVPAAQAQTPICASYARELAALQKELPFSSNKSFVISQIVELEMTMRDAGCSS